MKIGNKNIKNNKYRHGMNEKLIFYFSIVIITIALISYFIIKDEGWWKGINEKAPGWGNSQLLIILLSFILIISYTYTCYILSYLESGDIINLMHFTFFINCVLLSAYYYTLSDGIENYKEGAYVMSIVIFTTLFTVYHSFKLNLPLLKWISVLSISIVIYLTSWTWSMSEN